MLSGSYSHTQGANCGTVLDTANFRFNVSTTGKYKVEIQLNIQTATAGFDIFTWFRLNGSRTNGGGFNYAYCRQTAGSPWGQNIPMTFVWDFSSGDYFDIVSQSITASAMNATILNGSTISITRIE